MRSDELVTKHGFRGTLLVGSLQGAVSQWGLLPKRLKATLPPNRGVYAVTTPPGYECSMKKEVHRGKLHLRLDEEDSRCWVPDTDIIYIGKAGDPAGKRTLQDRIRELIRHGLGKAANHKGGQRIWLLERNDTFLLHWKECEHPRAYERQLISEFKEQHGGRRPFGNRGD